MHTVGMPTQTTPTNYCSNGVVSSPLETEGRIVMLAVMVVMVLGIGLELVVICVYTYIKCSRKPTKETYSHRKGVALDNMHNKDNEGPT